jgi:TetR/AcrR family transcriptional regulator, cholesterol catabolism regulator
VASARVAVRPRVEEQTRERILTEAAECFATQGYAATSIRDIARAVGVTVGAIYVHFPSKGRLLVAVYEEGVGRIGRAVDAALAKPGAPWEQLAAAAQAHLEMLLAQAGFARVIVRVVPADVPEVSGDLRRLRDGYEARFRRLIDALPVGPQIDRTLLRLMLLGSLNATQTWFKRGKGRADAAAIAGQFIAILRQGADIRGNDV